MRRIIYKVVVKDAEKVVAQTLAHIYFYVSCELLSFMRSLFQAAHVQSAVSFATLLMLLRPFILLHECVLHHTFVLHVLQSKVNYIWHATPPVISRLSPRRTTLCLIDEAIAGRVTCITN